MLPETSRSSRMPGSSMASSAVGHPLLPIHRDSATSKTDRCSSAYETMRQVQMTKRGWVGDDGSVTRRVKVTGIGREARPLRSCALPRSPDGQIEDAPCGAHRMEDRLRYGEESSRIGTVGIHWSRLRHMGLLHPILREVTHRGALFLLSAELRRPCVMKALRLLPQ